MSIEDLQKIREDMLMDYVCKRISREDARFVIGFLTREIECIARWEENNADIRFFV